MGDSNVIDSSDRIIKRISQENTQLRKKIRGVYERVRENERILTAFSEIEEVILGSTHLGALAKNLTSELQHRFHVYATLSIIRPLGERDPEEAPPPSAPRLYWISLDALSKRFPQGAKPLLLDRLSAEDQSVFFPSCPSKVGSVALVPLFLRGKLLGSLNLAAEEPGRYRSDKDTSFLEQLGRKVALGVENLWMIEQLAQCSRTDSLTGLYSRSLFEDVLLPEIGRWRPETSPFACILMDVEPPAAEAGSSIRNREEHAAVRFAAMLHATVRPNDICARLGDIRFAVVMPEAGEMEAASLAETLSQRAAAISLYGEDTPCGVTVRFAVATSETIEGGDPHAVLAEARRRLSASREESADRISGETVRDEEPSEPHEVPIAPTAR